MWPQVDSDVVVTLAGVGVLAALMFALGWLLRARVDRVALQAEARAEARFEALLRRELGALMEGLPGDTQPVAGALPTELAKTRVHRRPSVEARTQRVEVDPGRWGGAK